MDQESVRRHRIGIIPGDGIGPEVVHQGIKILERVSARGHFQYELIEYPWSSQYYLDTGQLMTADVLDDLRTLDAIYLGALGDPRVERGVVERSVIMTIRLGLDLFVNLRPISLYAEHLTPLKNVRPQDVNMVVIRENTEDVYVGIGGSLHEGTAHEIAIAEMVYTRHGVERAMRYAFDLAMSRPRRKLTLIDKSNAIRAHEIWRRTLREMAADYPGVETDAMYVDAAAMYMVMNPARFDVIVTTNLFGDIITDLGAAIQGGLGSAASGNIRPGAVSMFEPIHGSAPDIAGKNVASPIGAIAALGLLLDHLGERSAASWIDLSIRSCLLSGRLPNLGAESGLSTEAVGDLIASEIERVSM